MLRIGVIQFPGSNTERETILALQRVGLEAVEILWNDPPERLRACRGYVIIGGFSYEDRSRAGVIAALEPIMESLRREAEAGKPVLGICNGAQVLVETGLVPGLAGYRTGLALTNNRRLRDGHVLGTGYYNAWAHLQLSVPPERCAFTAGMSAGARLHVPFAHAEGRFVTDDTILQALIANDQTVFRYCDEHGHILPEFPVNPNGSLYNLAGACNPAGNVLALMPHPERTPNGDAIFASLRDYILSGQQPAQETLAAEPPPITIAPFTPDPAAQELIVESIITDNTAATVRNALARRGIAVRLTRHTHWEISATGDREQLSERIAAAGELYNSNKERPVTLAAAPGTVRLLVRSRTDVLGQQKAETLGKRFGLDTITAVRHGVLWSLTPSSAGNRETAVEQVQKVIDTHILFNPLAHDRFYYHHE